MITELQRGCPDVAFCWLRDTAVGVITSTGTGRCADNHEGSRNEHRYARSHDGSVPLTIDQDKHDLATVWTTPCIGYGSSELLAPTSAKLLAWPTFDLCSPESRLVSRLGART
jgi:hypothetical protein